MKDWLIMSNKPSKSSKLKKGHLQTSTFYWHNQYYETTLSGIGISNRSITSKSITQNTKNICVNSFEILLQIVNFS